MKAYKKALHRNKFHNVYVQRFYNLMVSVNEDKTRFNDKQLRLYYRLIDKMEGLK